MPARVTRLPTLIPACILAALGLLAGLSALHTQETGSRGGVGRAAIPALRAELLVEGRLFAEDRRAYREARETEQQRRQRAGELARQLDEAVADETPDAARLAELEASRQAARESAEHAARRAEELAARLVERLRRSERLRVELERLVGLAPEDPLTGTWEATLEPAGVTGTFVLDQDGALLRGHYRLEDGRRGSLTGSFSGSRVRLERIDRERGFDAVLAGEYDPSNQRLSGFWRPTDLSGGESGGGDWSATKLEESEQQEGGP